jgi:hypothetical protein
VDLLVEHWSEDWSELAWLRLGGLAALIDPGDEDHAAAVTELREKYPQYATHALDERPAIRIEILVARSWGRLEPSGRGGSPPRPAAGSGSSSSPRGSRRR